MSLSDEELERYARHLVLREVGGPGQARIRKTRVLVIGAGGLGSPLALYLAAAGIGALGLVDDDTVSLSNLQRQILYRARDVGRPKVEAGAEALEALNSGVRIEPHAVRLTADNALDLIGRYDLVADGSDNFATRFLVNDACFFAGRTLVSAAVTEFDGQLATYKAFDRSGSYPCYRCLFPGPDAGGAQLFPDRGSGGRRRGDGSAPGAGGAEGGGRDRRRAGGKTAHLRGAGRALPHRQRVARSGLPAMRPRPPDPEYYARLTGLNSVESRIRQHRGMSSQVHYEVFRRVGAKGSWTLAEVVASRDPAIKLAQTLMAEDKATGVKVVKETYNEETGDFLTLKIFEEGHNSSVSVPVSAEDAPPRPCPASSPTIFIPIMRARPSRG